MKLSWSGCFILQWILCQNFVYSETCYYLTSYYRLHTMETVYSVTFKYCRHGCCAPQTVCCDGATKVTNSSYSVNSGTSIAIVGSVAAVAIAMIFCCIFYRTCYLRHSGASNRIIRIHQQERNEQGLQNIHASSGQIQCVARTDDVILPPPYDVSIYLPLSQESNIINIQIGNRQGNIRNHTNGNSSLPPPYERDSSDNKNSAYPAETPPEYCDFDETPGYEIVHTPPPYMSIEER